MDSKPSVGRPRLLRQWDVLRMLPFSGSTLWRLVRDDRFPRPLKLSSRINAWRTDEVEAWLEARDRVGS